MFILSNKWLFSILSWNCLKSNNSKNAFQCKFSLVNCTVFNTATPTLQAPECGEITWLAGREVGTSRHHGRPCYLISHREKHHTHAASALCSIRIIVFRQYFPTGQNIPNLRNYCIMFSLAYWVIISSAFICMLCSHVPILLLPSIRMKTESLWSSCIWASTHSCVLK